MSTSNAAYAPDTLSFARDYSLKECIDHLADGGFVEFQLSLHPGFAWPSEMNATARGSLRRHIADRGLTLAAVNLPGVEINLGSLYPEMRAYTLDVLAQNIEIAGELGARSVIIAPGKHHPLLPASKETMMGHFYAALDVLAPLSERMKTTLCVENTPSSFLSSTEGLISALDNYGNDSIGVCYDVPNGHFVKEDVAPALRKLGDRLKLLHVADTTREAHRHAAVGAGDISFAEIGSALTAIKHKFRPVLEVITPDSDSDLQMTVKNLNAVGWGALH
jgi:L-ribulose-5-phosphate 3-epimerase